jgi:hypothetical protein
MGGHAFSFPKEDRSAAAPEGPDGPQIIPGLYCPRVPSPVYFAVRALVLNKLGAIFHKVVVPFEHPEKESFGDIDLLVCAFKGNSLQKNTIKDLEADIAQALGATRSRCNNIGVGYFALPVPKDIIALAGLESQGNERLYQLGSKDEYWVQIDIEVVDAPSQLEWTIFQTSHCTFRNILKYGLRPAGFVFMNNGLYIRVPGPDRLKRFGKKSPKTPLVFLSNDVGEILDYLRLSATAYGNLFDTMEDYWNYATSARHFSRKRLQPGVQQELEEDGETGNANPSNATIQEDVDNESVYSPEDVADENQAADIDPSKERRDGMHKLNDYLSTRTPWTKFTDDWIPAHPQVGAATPNVDQIFQEALDFFGARERCHVQWNHFINDRMDEQFWEAARTRLFESRYAELVNQEALDGYVSKGMSSKEALRQVISDVVSKVFPKEAKVQEKVTVERGSKLLEQVRSLINKSITALGSCVRLKASPGTVESPVPQKDEKYAETVAKEYKKKLEKHIRGTVNEAIIALKRWVIFESSQGKGKCPTQADEAQLDEHKHVKWLVESDEGGWSEEELLDWIDLHGFQVRETERVRTRPQRRAKDAERYDRRREEKMRSTVHGKVICYIIGGFKTAFGFGLKICTKLEDRWRAQQDIKVWTAEAPMDRATTVPA